MLEKYDDPIEVLVKFEGERIQPTYFRWDKKVYRVEKINLIYRERDGSDKIYYFSVSDNANNFKLAFFTRDLSWRILELFYV